MLLIEADVVQAPVRAEGNPFDLRDLTCMLHVRTVQREHQARVLHRAIKFEDRSFDRPTMQVPDTFDTTISIR